LVAGKLNAKAFTGGAKALADMQTDFNNKVGVKHGLLRGEFRSKAVHQDNAKIKPMVAERLELRKQVKALMVEVERLEKAVGGGSAALAAAQEALAKMQARYENSQKTTVQFMNDLNRIDKEKAAMAKELSTASERDHQLVAEITELRKENANAVASLEQLQAVNRVLVDQARARLAAEAAQQIEAEPVVQEIDLDAFKALQESFGAVKEASRGNLEHGRVVGAVNGLVVLHIGRGVHVFHKLPAGSQLPVVGKPLNEQQRGGVNR
jgi:chromosome segregation ATPase